MVNFEYYTSFTLLGGALGSSVKSSPTPMTCISREFHLCQLRIIGFWHFHPALTVTTAYTLFKVTGSGAGLRPARPQRLPSGLRGRRPFSRLAPRPAARARSACGGASPGGCPGAAGTQPGRPRAPAGLGWARRALPALRFPRPRRAGGERPGAGWPRAARDEAVLTRSGKPRVQPGRGSPEGCAFSCPGAGAVREREQQRTGPLSAAFARRSQRAARKGRRRAIRARSRCGS